MYRTASHEDMEYRKTLLFLYSFLCVDAQIWYLASPNGDIRKSSQESIEKQDKIKRFTPINTEKYQTKDNDMNIRIQNSNFKGNTQNFKPFHPLQVPNLEREETHEDNQAKTSYLTLNNTIENRNVLKIKCPKRKILRRCTRKPKQRKQFDANSTSYSRFLEVFEVVEFDHVVCFSSTGLEGTCLHEYDCEKIGGAAMGSCADGYGRCCVILFDCDTRSSSPIGWLTNPGYPSPYTERLSCTFTLDKFSSEVVQIRLDFVNFEILPPNAGTCEQDQFLISGQNVNNVFPILCGINTGQHAYIEVSRAEGPITFSFQTITEEKRLFTIKVTQIVSSDELKAPTGCLQYYKEDNGYLESFNYRETSQIGIPRTSSYFNNLNYAICIERSSTACSITYNNVGDLQIVNYDTDGLPVLPPRQAGVEIFDCPSDWLLIAAVRLCGERLNDGSILQDFNLDAPVTDDGSGPIVVWFRSDGIYAGRGFKLFYQQNSCIN